MTKQSTFNAGMKHAQANKPMPNMHGASYKAAQTFGAGYKFGKK